MQYYILNLYFKTRQFSDKVLVLENSKEIFFTVMIFI